MVKRFLLFALIAATICAARVHAAPTDVDVTARVDRTEVTVGDVVRYEITVTHSGQARVDLPAVRGNVGRFEVQDSRVAPGTTSDGRTRVTYTLTLTTFTLGPDTLPAQRVEVREASQGQGGDTAALVLYTQPTFVTVSRVSPENAKEIADITAPEPMPGSVPWGLLALAAAGAAYWFYRRWRKNHPRISAAAPLPPYEDALERLRALERAGLPSQGLGREFAFALSEILRGYVGLRFEIDALEATREEFLARAASLPLSASQQEWLRDFTGELDLVKFATGNLSEAEAARLLEAARDFVHATRPAPAVTPPPPGSTGSAQSPAGPA